MLKVAIIGLRGHQNVILEGIRQLPDAELVAVSEDDPALMDGVKTHPAATGMLKCYTDYRRLLDEQDIDIAGICGTDDVRAEIACECAQRGIHIIAEKPLAIDLDSLARLRETVETAGVRLTMLLTMRYEPAYVALRQAVSEGLVGEVCQVSAQKSYRLGTRPDWLKSRKTFSGIIPYVGVHALDLMRWTSGREFVEVAAFHANAGHPELREMEDTAAVLVRLDNGGNGAARLDYCRPAAAPTHGDDRLRVAGNRGVIEVIQGNAPKLIGADEPERVLPVGKHDSLFVDFAAAVAAGSQSRVPEADCFRITEIVLKARQAADDGKVYTV